MRFRKKCKDGLSSLGSFVMDEDAKVSQKGLIIGSLGVIGFAIDELASGATEPAHSTCTKTDNCGGDHVNNIGVNNHTSYKQHVDHCN